MTKRIDPMMLFERVRRFLAARLDTKTFLGLDLTILLVVAAGAMWLFGALVDAVLDNATVVRLDVAAANWIHARVTPGGLTAMRGISRIASPSAIIGVGVAGGLMLAAYRRTTMLITWVLAFAGSSILERVLKAALQRDRPLFGDSDVVSRSFSFPSGHSTMVMAGALMVLFVVRHFHLLRGRAYAALAVGVSIVVLLVGVSRVYLGVHYPSDVLGGFAVSAAWVSVCIGVAGVVLHNRGESLSS